MESIMSIQGRISKDRKRTNLLKDTEQATLAWLCSVLPIWMTSDVLTFIGFVGSLVVFTGFCLAKFNIYFLTLSITGLMIQWFGDSLDGRIAYYRNVSRKWYGFALDMCMDWVSTGLMGFGFYFFMEPPYKVIALLFVAAYAWSMILALLRYKIINVYSIDSGMVGPTELRIGIAIMLTLAMVVPNTLVIIAALVTGIVYIVNFIDFYKILKYGDDKDREEKRELQRNN
ncbi:MAG TPA: hypothetical protein VK154_14950 [Chitinophagales bacterium]|nr:hypothetical protein [Chitinophagales bacterium]